jgi:predicted Rossmann fold flavoprotein
MIYDVIIIGAGAAGLFTGASYPNTVKGLIIEKTKSPGNKLLMSGAGQCNLTCGGSIKDFISHYGENGRKIRYALYKFSNVAVRHFFESNGVRLVEREDGKVFPASLKSKEIVNLLVNRCQNNGFQFVYDSPVDVLVYNNEDSGKNAKTFTIIGPSGTYKCRKLVIACGGSSYPATGSDGSILNVLRNMHIEVVNPRPALVPIHVNNYPYEMLAGISFKNAKVSVFSQEKLPGVDRKNVKTILAEVQGDLLLTHRNFSGPSIINISRYADTDQHLQINYYTLKDPKTILTGLKNRIPGCQQQLLAFLYDYLELPKRFLEILCVRAKADPTEKISQIPDRQLKTIITLLTSDSYKISGLGGYNIAMVTAGGVSLNEINLKSMESEKYPGLFFAGEILDVDGDTGGYNLQFAFSSAYLCANK